MVTRGDDLMLTAPPAAGTKLMMLALTGKFRKPRVVTGGPDIERWARSWARQWWVVEAKTVAEARDSIARYQEKCARTSLNTPVDAAVYGIHATGRNASSGLELPPGPERERLRPAPAAAARRRAKARAPTREGAATR
jgi:hypothetical protein